MIFRRRKSKSVSDGTDSMPALVRRIEGYGTMWPPVHVASRLYDIANVLLVVSLVVGVVSTAVVVWMGKVKEEYAARELARTSLRVAIAHKRAATLEQEAAEARLETEKIRAALAWRTLSMQQVQTLWEALHGQSIGTVWVNTVKSDPEAVHYWEAMCSALRAAGVTVQPVTTYARAVGVSLAPSDKPGRAILRDALERAGIAVRDHGEGDEDHKGIDALQLVIGSKPPPE